MNASFGRYARSIKQRLTLQGQQIAERHVQLALDEHHFRPMAQVDGPVEVCLVDEHERERHKRERREEARAEQQDSPRPHFTVAKWAAAAAAPCSHYGSTVRLRRWHGFGGHHARRRW